MAEEKCIQWCGWIGPNNLRRFITILIIGSVTDETAPELITETDIDGFLVGGASLKEQFGTIIQSYKFKL